MGKPTKNVFLFDMDGVLIDTEPLYSSFWQDIALKYNILIDDFSNRVKGIKIEDIVCNFLSCLSSNEIRSVLADFKEFESNVEFPDVPGAIDFIVSLKSVGIRSALVTSSSELKLRRVLEIKQFEDIFDTIVSAKDIERGKPFPDCFLLAAKKLKAKTSECIVFEDSLPGIKAGLTAEMDVIGLSTTLSEEVLQNYCHLAIPDFRDLTVRYLRSIFE